MKLIITLLLSTLALYANSAFISVQDLHKQLDKKNLVIIDTTDIQTYSLGHIPNARQTKISAFRTLVDNKYELMRPSHEIQIAAQQLGINQDSYVVLYGHNKPKELLKASYIALALITNGFTNISILDGGYEAWLSKFGTNKELISTEVPSIAKGNFVAKHNPNVVVDMKYVQEHIGKVAMIEARERKYFDGKDQSPGVKRLGHIKDAQSSNWQEKFQTNEKVVSDKKLKSIFYDEHKLEADKEVITYCTGGLEASMNWYILTQHLHFKDVKMYDASMKEWGNIDSTPMEKMQK